MTFKKIIAVDHTGLEEWAMKEVENLADTAVFYNDDPLDEAECIQRVAGADAILVSWRTPIRRSVIDACPDLKYIGMCCSLLDEKSANVDVAYAKQKGIQVLGVRDYGDEGLVEFIISELIRLLHGFGEHQWSPKQEELTGKTLGIIGMGVTGQMLMERALAFGMNIRYYSRTRKPDIEGPRVCYGTLDQVLEASQIVSTHLPKNSIVIQKEGFEKLGKGKILINTSLEPTFDVEAFKVWVSQEGNYAIFDKGGLGIHFDVLTSLHKVIYTSKVTGFTKQAEGRLSTKVLENMEAVLNGRRT